MHHMGSITSIATKPCMLYDFMRQHLSQWHSAYDLAMRIRSTCISTVMSTVRRQLGPTPYAIERTSGFIADGTMNNFYRLVRKDGLIYDPQADQVNA